MRTSLILVAVAVLVATAAARAPRAGQLAGYTFERYVDDLGKQYATPAESAARAAVFRRRLAAAQQHNAGTSSYKMGVNHLTDRTDAELAAMMGNRAGLKAAMPPAPAPVSTGAPMPASFDYRNSVPAVLSAVKNQGQCGSCWTFSAMESIESHYAIQHRDLFVLSTQQLVACDKACFGCGGGLPSMAFEYFAKRNQSLQSEFQYPYTAYYGTNGECQLTANNSLANTNVGVTGYVAVPTNDAAATMEALVTTGPISIGVAASTWSPYESGVFDGCQGNVSIDHAVQLVGYGHDDDLGKDYWIVRNSWAPSWGEHGFIRLQRNAKKEHCTWNVYPGQKPQLVCGLCGLLSQTTYPLVKTMAPAAAVQVKTFAGKKCTGKSRSEPLPVKKCYTVGPNQTLWVEVKQGAKQFIQATVGTDCAANATGKQSYWACDTLLNEAALGYFEITGCAAKNATLLAGCNSKGQGCQPPFALPVGTCVMAGTKGVTANGFASTAASVSESLFATADCSGPASFGVSPCGLCSDIAPLAGTHVGEYQC
jgi:cathepsin L